uniref:Uncharacterized protein n=1 Tax=Romanomermis culicivorax TaxID=13658 RepID=A0A915ILW5_ROMCU
MHYDDESRRATSSRRPGTFAGLSPEKFVLASSTNDSSNNNNNNVNFINKIKNFSFWPPQSKKRRRNKYNNNSSIIDNSDDSKVDELHQRERESSLSENNGKKTYRHYELFITKLENSQIFENKRNFFRLLEDIRAENNGHDDYQQKKRAPQIWSQKIDTGLVNHLSKKFIGTSDAAFPTNELKREILADNDETLFYLRFKREKSEPKDSRVSEEDRKFRNNRLSWATSYSLDTGRDLGQAPDTLHHNTNNLALIGGAPTCVWRLAKKFESGDMDQVGPLKLYQTQVYKRELEKICVHNQGDVHQKACMFEDGRSRSKESETPEDDQSTSTRRQESFMRAVLHMDPEHHRITDKDLRELDRRTKRRISYIKATNVTPSSSAAAQSTKTLGRKKMSSSVFVADPGDESSNLESFDYDKNTRQENKRIMPRSISNDQPINRKSLDWSKNDDIAKQVHRLSTISSSSCLYDR